MRSLLFAVAVLLVTAARGPAQPPTVAELVRRLEAGTPGEWVIATEMLGQRGPAAADAVPALAKVMRATNLADHQPAPFEPQPDRSEVLRFVAARDALARIGPKAAPALAGLLTHDSALVREQAALALGWLRADAADAVPALATFLADADPVVRAAAVEALRQIGLKAEPAVAALAALAAAPEPKGPPVLAGGRPGNPKDAAVQALVAIGPAGRAALREKVLPGLIAELRTAEPVPWTGPGIGLLAALGADAAPAIPAVQAYIRRRANGSDLDGLAPTLLHLGPAGFKAFEELLADEKADRRALLGSLSTSRAYGNETDLTPLVPTLLRALRDPDPAVRRAAGLAVAGQGEKTPAEAIELLATRLTDPHPDVPYTFVKIGRPAVPVLVKALASADPAVRRRAATALRDIGGAARPALPGLRALARDADAGVAVEASAAAARIGLDPKDAADALRDLAAEDPAAVLAALGRARALGPLAAAHHADLIPLLTDEDAKVREAALDVALVLGRTAPEVVAALARELPPPARWGRLQFGFARAPLPTFRPAVPALRRALTGPDPDARQAAARLLAQIGPGARDAAPDLVALLAKEPDPGQATLLLAALAAIGPGAKDAVPVLMTRPLPERDAVLCLAAIGPAARAAVPALRRNTADPDPEVRLAAAYALARIEGDVGPYREAIDRGLLAHPGGWGEPTGLTVFSGLAPDCPELIPAAVRLLPSASPIGKQVIVTALGKYGPAAKDVVPDLVKQFGEVTVPQVMLVETLGAIGPEARAALPGLRTLLDDRDVWVAVAARDAIGRIEGTKPAD